MNPTVDLETTIIDYLAIQPSGVLLIAANQRRGAAAPKGSH
jgi:hypothetical protein